MLPRTAAQNEIDLIAGFSRSLSVDQATKLRTELCADSSVRYQQMFSSWCQKAASNSPLLVIHTAVVGDASTTLSFSYGVTTGIAVSLRTTLPAKLRQWDDPFHFTLTEPYSPCSVDLYEVLNDHNLYVRGQRPRSSRFLCCFRPRQECEDTFLINLFGQSPCLLVDFSVKYSLDRSLIALPIFQQAHAPSFDMNGVMLDDMKLLLSLGIAKSGSQSKMVRLTATARATIIDKENDLIPVTAQVSTPLHFDGQVADLVIDGHAADLIRVVDVMQFYADSPSRSSASPLLEHALNQYSLHPIQHIPQLDGVTDTANQTFQQGCNKLLVRYDFRTRRLDNIKFKNLMFQSTCALALPVLVSCDKPNAATQITELSLAPLLLHELMNRHQLHDRYHVIRVLSCSDWLDLVGMSDVLEHVPQSVKSCVNICSSTIKLFVDSVDCRLLGWSATAVCGASKADEIRLFHRLVKGAVLPEPAHIYDTKSVTSAHKCDTTSWLEIRCFQSANIWLDPSIQSVVPAYITDPEVVYVFSQSPDDQHSNLTDGQSSIETFATTNMFVVNHPLLEAGRMVIPLTNNSLLHHESGMAITSSSQLSIVQPVRPREPISGQQQVLTQVAMQMQDVWFMCLDYLDLNLIIFGLVPTLHPTLDASVLSTTSTKYWKRRLIVEFGDMSDVRLFDTTMLDKLRSEMFHRLYVEDRDERQAAYRQEKYWYGGQQTKFCDDMPTRIDQETKQLAKYCSHYLAAVDYQCRINLYSRGVMQHDEHRVLPQRQMMCESSCQPSQMSINRSVIRPPLAACRLMLCTPPFVPMLCKTYAGAELSYTADPPSVERNLYNQCNSHGLRHFLSFMEYGGGCRQSRLALYAGPLYVYEDETKSHVGIRVDLSDELRQSLDPQNYVQNMSRTIRMIDNVDSNHWPVAERGTGCCAPNSLAIVAPNLHEFFELHGLNRMISQIKRYWMNHLLVSEQDEVLGEDTSDVSYDEDYFGGGDELEYDWSKFVPSSRQPSIARPLMDKLMEHWAEFMLESDTWSEGVQEEKS